MTYILSQKLNCPKCNSEDIVYAEDVTHYYTVYGVSGAKQVLVCNEETIGNGFNEQFICNKCFNTWSVDQPLAFTFYNQIEEDFDE